MVDENKENNKHEYVEEGSKPKVIYCPPIMGSDGRNRRSLIS